MLPLLAEPKVQPGVAMQEDLWDADWEAHQSLFKAWMGIKENAGHRYELLLYCSISSAAHRASLPLLPYELHCFILACVTLQL